MNNQTLQVIITDTHFGVKNNSMTWLNSQILFIDEQLLPFLKSAKSKYDRVEVYHLGDTFDSRSSINPFVFYTVQQRFCDIANAVDLFVIIGGNHDYYSPNDMGYNVSSVDMLKLPSNAIVLTQQHAAIGGFLLIPWFSFHNQDKLKSALKENGWSIILTHTDLAHLEPELKSMIHGKNVLSGHIHTPEAHGNQINLGSCYSIDFNDANSKRGFYTIEDNDISTLKFVENTKSIKFYRIYSKDFERKLPEIARNDYVEVYVDSKTYATESVANEIARLNEISNSCNVIVNNAQVAIDESFNASDFDIIDICRRHIPEHLIDKFEKTVDSIKN